MLGELVAQEVKRIANEKERPCPANAVNGAARAIKVYMAQNNCECPVCPTTRDMLLEQLEGLAAMFKNHATMEKEMRRVSSDLIFVAHGPEAQTQFDLYLTEAAAILTLATTLQASVKRFICLCQAAHYAYEIVGSGARAETLRAKISVLTQQGIKHTEHTLDGLIEQNRDRNHNDVN